MNKLILIAAGVFIGYILFSKRSGKDGETIKLGSKGKEIEELQKNLNKIYNADFLTNIGTYDKVTKTSVVDLFENTSGIVDYDTGELRTEFIKDFNIIFNKILK